MEPWNSDLSNDICFAKIRFFFIIKYQGEEKKSFLKKERLASRIIFTRICLKVYFTVHINVFFSIWLVASV